MDCGLGPFWDHPRGPPRDRRIAAARGDSGGGGGLPGVVRPAPVASRASRRHRQRRDRRQPRLLARPPVWPSGCRTVRALGAQTSACGGCRAVDTAVRSSRGWCRTIRGRRTLSGRPLGGGLGLAFRSFFVGNLLGAVLFVPYAVGIGYAIGYGLGPYVSRIQHTLGGLGRVLLIVMIIGIASVVGWRTGIRVVRLALQRTLRVLRPRQGRAP